VPPSQARGADAERHGFDHRLTTPVYTLGHKSGGTLSGNLVLVAQGDLTMGGRTKPDGSVDFTNLDHGDASDAVQGVPRRLRLGTEKQPQKATI
jgi:D-alanyl-D-alanine carboxypeptidase